MRIIVKNEGRLSESNPIMTSMSSKIRKAITVSKEIQTEEEL